MNNGKPVAEKLKNPRVLLTISVLQKIFFLILPWQTVWIIKERYWGSIKWQYGTFSVYLSQLILLFAAACYIYHQNQTGQKIIKNKKNFWVVLISWVFVTVTGFWSAHPEISFQQSLHILIAILTGWIILVGPLDLASLRKWFIWGAIPAALLGIWQFWSQNTIGFKYLGIVEFHAFEPGAPILGGKEIGRLLRAYAAFPSPNIFGGYLFMAISFLLSDWKIFLQKYKIFLPSLVLSILVLAIFYTFSRSALLSLCLFLIFFSVKIFLRREKIFYLPLAVVLILLTSQNIICLPLLKTRVSLSSPQETRSLTERIKGSKVAWQVIKNNPLLGAGLGNYTAATLNMEGLEGIRSQPVHNFFLLLVSELGLLGCIFLSAILTISYGKIKGYLWSLVFLLPILIFDHYLFSLPIGLMLFAVYLATSPQIIHFLSTQRSEKW